MVFTIEAGDMWQTTDLDHAVAEELFGWKWMAFKGIPIRDAPGYPEKCRVRRFISPESLKNKRWKEYFAETNGAPATGEEPLSYCYCSSRGPEMVPHFSGHADAVREMEDEINRRGLWDKYADALAAQVGGSPKNLMRAKCEDKCIAALVAVGSKYIREEPAA